MGNGRWKTSDEDLRILCGLARRVREISETAENAERRRAWLAHSRLEGERPMVLIEAFGIDEREMPAEYVRLDCAEDWAREIEGKLRRTVYQFEKIRDDVVVEPVFGCPWQVRISNYGVEETYTHGHNPDGKASYRWDAPIKDIDGEFDRLHPRTIAVDREESLLWKAHLEEVFDGALPVRMRGTFWWTMGMTWEAVKLVGLEGLMLLMYDDPAGLHRLMAFLRDDHLSLAARLEEEGLLTPNNENDYIGSGSAGYTEELPQDDFAGGVRTKDMWVLLESQETVGVSPEHFEEFIFPYQLAIAKRFGLVYYGCCEPVHSRWHVIEKLPGLRRVSVSPWCDEEFMGEALRGRYAYCRKPNPSLISTDRFDEEAMRRDIRTTLLAAGTSNVELVMKDVHTVRSHPERLGRWVEIAREVTREFT